MDNKVFIHKLLVSSANSRVSRSSLSGKCRYNETCSQSADTDPAWNASCLLQ